MRAADVDQDLPFECWPIQLNTLLCKCASAPMAGKYSCEEQQLVSVALGAGGDWALVVIN